MWSQITQAMLDEAGADMMESEGVIDQLQSIDTMEIALLFKENSPGVTKVSVRTRDPYDATAVCRPFGGGGHHRAAGAELREPLAVFEPRVLDVARELLRSSQVTPALAGPRASATTRSGILAIDKPAGMTSFDAVRVVRRVFNERRVGHAGTLDPTATGLLPVCIGQATRLVDYFHQQSKTYRCVVRFGEVSDTLDTEGDGGRRRRRVGAHRGARCARRPRSSSATSSRCRRCTRRCATRASTSTSSRAAARRWSASRARRASRASR